MTDTTATTEAAVVADLTRATATPEVVAAHDVDLATVFVPGHGQLTLVDERRRGYAPPRKIGQVALHDAESLAAYVNAHRTDGTALYGDARGASIVAVLNDHEPGAAAAAGWGDHTATWKLRHTPQWAAWHGHAGQWMSQRAFAEHLEDNAADVIEPSAADMLEVAQTLQANKSVAFRAHTRLRDGQTQLTYEETIESKAGQRGQLDVPTTFAIGVAVFDGLDAYKLQARFRFRVSDGDLAVMYRLERTTDVLAEAFNQAWHLVLPLVDDVDLSVLGTPPQGSRLA